MAKTTTQTPFPIEEKIKLAITGDGDSGFEVKSSGMLALGKPEVSMLVAEQMNLAWACRILNDAARHVVSRNVDVATGFCLQLCPWTVVEFEKVSDALLRLKGIPYANVVWETQAAV